MGFIDSFVRFSRAAAAALGSPTTFFINCVLIALWAVAGPFYGFSDSWQLVVNTATTVLTYLAVFVLQNSQNRDSKVMQLKLDELIRSVKAARNHLVDLENLSEQELQELEAQFKQLSQHAREHRSIPMAGDHPKNDTK